MPAKHQLSLLEEDFSTQRPANPLFCHQDFLEKLGDYGHHPIARRTAFLMQRLSIDSRRLHYKPTQGVNRGWRRSRLGGNAGSHFYAWWAPSNAVPLRTSGFESAPDGAIFLRDIRHHDDHSPLEAQSFESQYMPVTVRDLRAEEYAPQPMTQPQVRFATARHSVRLLKGHPGSGKTTALLHAADIASGARVLYVTYSSHLATLARDYFDRYCPAHKEVHVITYSALVRQVLGTDNSVTPAAESIQRFRRDLVSFARGLGPWAGNQTALYDELHAHLAGDALPVAIGRFPACTRPQVAGRAYLERRTRPIGNAAASAAQDVAARLERSESTGLTERYFPEIALAWKAAERIRSGSLPADSPLLSFDCIAVDECQDLTPIEALAIAELALASNRRKGSPVTLLMAGDEAQTVRPTDFEWGWLSDILHARITTPSEFKLASNLRSPRKIADLINRVWDLYSCVGKSERPSGTGYAEIEDDGFDQILYGTAVPGPDLDKLITTLSEREGLAIISLSDDVPAWVPAAARSSVLTVGEAKGLDFHSVCILDPGKHVQRVTGEVRASESGISDLWKRLAIDQLRVAVSRPTERLIWLDVSPTDKIIKQSTDFLKGREPDDHVASCVPAVILKTLEEDELDPEERLQRCQEDARQYLHVRPELAWSRARQAVNQLSDGAFALKERDPLSRAAWQTLAEVCFVLGFRRTQLPPEVGHPDLWREAAEACRRAGVTGMGSVIRCIGRVMNANYEHRLSELVQLAQILPGYRDELQSWLLVEIASKVPVWVEELEAALFNGHNAGILIRILPEFYGAVNLPDREARLARVQQRAVQLMIKEKQFNSALTALATMQERQPKLEAICHEGLGDFRAAAECHVAAGNLKDALACYRSVPDFEASLRLIRRIGDHPAAESLEWIARVQELVDQRPEKFGRTVTDPEKKLLQDMLERALGVSRRKPAAKKAAAKKTAAKKAAAPRKRATATAAAQKR